MQIYLTWHFVENITFAQWIRCLHSVLYIDVAVIVQIAFASARNGLYIVVYVPKMSINHIYVDACLFRVCFYYIAYSILIKVAGILYIHHVQTIALLYAMIQPIRPNPLTLIFYNYPHVISEFKWTISPSFRHYMFQKTIRSINNPYQNQPVCEHGSSSENAELYTLYTK